MTRLGTAAARASVAAPRNSNSGSKGLQQQEIGQRNDPTAVLGSPNMAALWARPRQLHPWRQPTTHLEQSLSRLLTWWLLLLAAAVTRPCLRGLPHGPQWWWPPAALHSRPAGLPSISSQQRSSTQTPPNRAPQPKGGLKVLW